MEKITFFKLALFLFAIRIVLSIIGGSITLTKTINGMTGFLKDFINLFTGKKEPNTEPQPQQQNSEPIVESIIRLFEIYSYEKILI